MDFIYKTYPDINGTIREIGEKYHPQRNEIYHVVRMMRNLGVNLNLIAASLNLQKYSGSDEGRCQSSRGNHLPGTI